MRIILAGATGFIGKKLVQALLAKGNEVFVLTRSIAQVVRDESNRTLVPWDGKNVGGWWEYMNGADAVINLAGENIAGEKWTPQRKQKILSSRLDATCAIVQALKSVAHKPRTFINASAVGYYGNVPEEDVTEVSPCGKGFLAEVCECWEEAALRVSHSGIRVVVARFGIVLGKDGGMLGKIWPLFRYFLGGVPGSGKQWVSWIHRDDLIEALAFLLWEDSLSGPVNVTAPVPQRMDVFCRSLSQVISRPLYFKIPSFILKGLFGEMSEVFLTGQKALPRKLIRAGFSFRYFSLEQALHGIFL